MNNRTLQYLLLIFLTFAMLDSARGEINLNDLLESVSQCDGLHVEGYSAFTNPKTFDIFIPNDKDNLKDVIAVLSTSRYRKLDPNSRFFSRERISIDVMKNHKNMRHFDILSESVLVLDDKTLYGQIRSNKLISDPLVKLIVSCQSINKQ